MRPTLFGIPLLTTALVLAVFVACAPLGDLEVLEDFQTVFAREAATGLEAQIHDHGVGEGDEDNQYQIVTFDVVVRTSVTPETGWFMGMELRAGEQLRGGELEMRYSREQNSGWKFEDYQLVKAPKRQHNY